VCLDHDTGAFAAGTIDRWWERWGSKSYPEARELLITADGGGSNNPRSRLWLTELQKLADKHRLTITMCHLPPGTSKWNKIEYLMFSFILLRMFPYELLLRAP